jgi:hypothetical protein
LFEAVYVRRTLIFVIITVAAVSSSQAQLRGRDRNAGSMVSAPAKTGPFVLGERLSYDVSWSSFMVAGELTIETKSRGPFQGIDAYHVTAQAESVGPVKAFVSKVNDLYDSFVDARTYRPVHAEKHSQHGKKREQTSITLDSERRTARLTDGRSIEIPPETYDLASLLFAVRQIDLNPGKNTTFSLLEDDRLYTVRVEPEARDKAYTHLGTYDTYRLAIKLVEGREIKDPYKLRLYLTNDSRRLPVLLTAEPSWGQIRVELTSTN